MRKLMLLVLGVVFLVGCSIEAQTSKLTRLPDPPEEKNPDGSPKKPGQWVYYTQGNSKDWLGQNLLTQQVWYWDSKQMAWAPVQMATTGGPGLMPSFASGTGSATMTGVGAALLWPETNVRAGNASANSNATGGNANSNATANQPAAAKSVIFSN